MAKNNPGDVLTGDWNPVIGCERYSVGCKGCWYLDGIFPWQQRLGNIPADVKANAHYLFQSRLSVDALKLKNGIVGIVQHGDLFWDKVPEAVIQKVLDIVESTATQKRKQPKYLLWTKRVKRAAKLLNKRYKKLPDFLGIGVSVETQEVADERLPWLSTINGMKAIVLEPQLSKVVLGSHIDGVSWVIVGSETGDGARPYNLDWARSIRDETKNNDIPFFIKQMGASHKQQVRELDGVEWTEFPTGWVK